MAGGIAGVEVVGQDGDPKADSRLDEWKVCLHQAYKRPVIVSVYVNPIGDRWVLSEKRQ
jgi:hypothetical protein